MLRQFKSFMKEALPDELVFLYGNVRTGAFPEDRQAVRDFLADTRIPVSLDRWALLRKLYRVSIDVNCPHTQAEILAYVTAILTTSSAVPGCFVEAGCFKGGSTAKFSLAAYHAGRDLVVFDSFEGIPENDEAHRINIFGGPASFRRGDYCGALDEVKANVARYGRLDVCRFVQGWFDDTMPSFEEPIAGIYLDCDLVSSTRTCLKHLYPLLQPGGVLFSQDGHLPLVLELLADDTFWQDELGVPRPHIEGLGEKKLVRIVKPRAATPLEALSA